MVYDHRSERDVSSAPYHASILTRTFSIDHTAGSFLEAMTWLRDRMAATVNSGIRIEVAEVRQNGHPVFWLAGYGSGGSIV